MYASTYTHMYVCICICIYIYIYGGVRFRAGTPAASLEILRAGARSGKGVQQASGVYQVS